MDQIKDDALKQAAYSQGVTRQSQVTEPEVTHTDSQNFVNSWLKDKNNKLKQQVEKIKATTGQQTIEVKQ